jgi:hypothetical protein
MIFKTFSNDFQCICPSSSSSFLFTRLHKNYFASYDAFPTIKLCLLEDINYTRVQKFQMTISNRIILVLLLSYRTPILFQLLSCI